MRPDRVRVHGPDAASFLQGQLSQDVGALVPGTGAPSFVLEPSGKTLAWVQVERVADDDFVLSVDASFGAVVIARLVRFKLRTKAEVEPIEAGPDDGIDAVDRIERGIPAMGAEITDETIPAELGQWIMDASVSFTKGCYTGQELVARIDSRGNNVPRHLRGLVADASAGDDGSAGDAGAPEVGAPVLVDGKAVGVITSVAVRPDGVPIALAFIHRSVEPPATTNLGRIVDLPIAP